MKYRYDLLKIKFLKSLFKARPLQFFLQILPVFLFVLVILTGMFGSQIPARNIATVLTWTIWWAGIIFLILFLGASWCLICPWMAVGNWIQRLSFWKKNDKPLGLGNKWSWKRNRYPAIIFFFIVSALELGIFITYSPLYTAYLSIFILFLAVMTALIWDKNIFCRYICFVGAIVGMYSNLSPVEARSRDKDVCGRCKTKDCIKGNADGYGCPIFEYPGGMEKNTNCILCTECIKTCPNDNMTLNIRPFLSDLTNLPSPQSSPRRGEEVKGESSPFRGEGLNKFPLPLGERVRVRGRMDEAMLSLTLLGLTIFHGVTMLPVWYNWAVKAMEKGYFYYLFSFILIQAVFVLLPIVLHYIFSWMTANIFRTPNHEPRTPNNIFISFSYSFLPVAIAYHFSHNLSHIKNEGYKIISVISDPFGWGWNLFGTNPPVHHFNPPIPPLLKGGDVGLGHSMHSMAMLHQSGISLLDIIVVTLGFLSGVYIAYKTYRSHAEHGNELLRLTTHHSTLNTYLGLFPFIILITLYSIATLYLLNQPMVMRMQ